MPGNAGMLDVALGLAVVYLVLSLICSSVNEGIETFVKSRSRQLERGIREILADPNGTELTDRFYNHPLITGLFQGDYNPADLRPGRILAGKFYSKTNLPSYIPAPTFALVMLDLILPATSAEAGGVAGTLRPAGEGSQELAIRLRDAAANFPNRTLSKTMLLLIDASAFDLVKLRESVEGLFDSTMDRVSGWYKRRTQIILFSVAISVSALLNIDTVAIANHLATDPSVRASLVGVAQSYAASEKAGPRPPVPADGEALKSLKDLGVPIGWNPKERPTGVYPWALKITGILASALAAALGAPFWFDVLNRFVVVRSTIKPREKSKEEGSKE